MNMVYFYEIGYHTMEESPVISLYHHKQFSKEEFDDIVAQSYARAWDNTHLRKDENNIDIDFDRPTISCDDLLSDTIKILISDFGFDTIKYTHSFSPFGWADVENEDDWATEVTNDKELKLIQEKVNHLKKIEERENRLGDILD